MVSENFSLQNPLG